jgi:hypothetical protein
MRCFGRTVSHVARGAFKILGEITRPLIELDHRWPTESLDNDGGRHPTAVLNDALEAAGLRVRSFAAAVASMVITIVVRARSG